MNAWHQAAAAGFAFVVGSSVGSFLNVCIWRLPRGESVLHPPSRCPSCGSSIRAGDNIPLLGWLRLRGKCRACAWPIPARYPMVEAFVGCLFALIMAIEVCGNDPFENRLAECVTHLLNQSILVAMLVTLAMIEWDASTHRSSLPERDLMKSSNGLTTILALALVMIFSLAMTKDLVGEFLGLCLLAALISQWNRRGFHGAPAG